MYWTIVALIGLVLLLIGFYLIWHTNRYPYSFACDHEGCGFRVAGTLEGFVEYVEFQHMLHHKESTRAHPIFN